MKPKISHPEVHPRRDPELRELAELVGQFIEYWGFKAVQGRTWCYLFLSARPLSSIELAQLLEVSPALVTQSVQVLLEYRVILAAEKGPNGVLRYQANPDVSEAIAGVLRGRESLMLSRIQTAGRMAEKKMRPQTGSGFEVAPDRMGQVNAWVNLAKLFLDSGLGLLAKRKNPFSEPQSFRNWKL